MARIYNPPHPGKVLNDGSLRLGSRVRTFAKRLGLSSDAFEDIVAGHAQIRPELAQQLASVLGGFGGFMVAAARAHDLLRADIPKSEQ